MTDNTRRGWLLVTLAIIGLALAVSVVSASGGELTQKTEMVAAESPAIVTVETAPWMAHHADTGVDQMEPHMRQPTDEMATRMSSSATDMHSQWTATEQQDRPHGGDINERMNGYGHGC